MFTPMGYSGGVGLIVGFRGSISRVGGTKKELPRSAVFLPCVSMAGRDDVDKAGQLLVTRSQCLVNIGYVLGSQ